MDHDELYEKVCKPSHDRLARGQEETHKKLDALAATIIRVDAVQQVPQPAALLPPPAEPPPSSPKRTVFRYKDAELETNQLEVAKFLVTAIGRVVLALAVILALWFLKRHGEAMEASETKALPRIEVTHADN